MTMQDIRSGYPPADTPKPGATALENGLGAWATAISADDNAQAAIALAEAINRARHAQAHRDNRAADSRVLAVSRLETLRARLVPIYAAIPRDVELFDLGVVGHDPPRLFVDIVAFVEIAEDRRSFRLMQETRNGRVSLGEAPDEKQMAALVTDYIALRLVERERALGAQAIAHKPAPLPKATDGFSIAQPAPKPEATAPSLAGPAPESQSGSGAEPHDRTALPVRQTPLAPVTPTAPAPAAMPTVIVPTGQTRGGSWIWPILALFIGVGLGALALYLYAANMIRP